MQASMSDLLAEGGIMTEVLSLCFDGRVVVGDSNQPSQQLDAHLVTVSGVAGTLAAALSARREESLSECAYFLELELQRLRELLAGCEIIPIENEESSEEEGA